MKVFITLVVLFSTVVLTAIDIYSDGWLRDLYCTDFDLDGDVDIILGHNSVAYELWPSFSIIENFNNTEFAETHRILDHYRRPVANHKRTFMQDVNNDGYKDICGVEYLDSLFYLCVGYNNNGDFEFELFEPPFAAMDNLTYGDWNQDGFTDVFFHFIFYDYHQYAYFLNDGTGDFVYQNSFEMDISGRMYFSDLDNNGFDEMYYVCNDSIGYYLRQYQYPDWVSPTLVFNLDNNIYANFFFDIDDDGDLDFSHFSFNWTNDIVDIKILENLGEFQFNVHDNSLIFPDLQYVYYWNPVFVNFNADSFPDLINFHVAIMNNNAFSFDEIQTFNWNLMGPWGDYPLFDYCDIDGNGFVDYIGIGTSGHVNCTRIMFNDGNGNFLPEPQVSIDEEVIVNNDNWELSNFPNPVSLSKLNRDGCATTFSFLLPDNVINPTLEIFNIKGQSIRELQISDNKQSEVIWDGTNQHQSKVASGIYLYRIKGDNQQSLVKKMMILK